MFGKDRKVERRSKLRIDCREFKNEISFFVDFNIDIVEVGIVRRALAEPINKLGGKDYILSSEWFSVRPFEIVFKLDRPDFGAVVRSDGLSKCVANMPRRV